MAKKHGSKKAGQQKNGSYWIEFKTPLLVILGFIDKKTPKQLNFQSCIKLETMDWNEKYLKAKAGEEDYNLVTGVGLGLECPIVRKCKFDINL